MLFQHTHGETVGNTCQDGTQVQMPILSLQIVQKWNLMRHIEIMNMQEEE